MNPSDEERLTRLLESVEKEEREINNSLQNNINSLRRQLFSQEEDNVFICEEDDEVDAIRLSEHNSDTEEENSDCEERQSGDVAPNETHANEDRIEENNNQGEEAASLSTRQPARRIPQLARRQHPSVRSEFTADGKRYLGNDGLTEWEMEGSRGRMGRTPARNVVIRLPGPKGNARNARSPLETFSLYFPDSLLDKIVNYTNMYIESIKDNYTRDRDALPTTIEELKSLIGLLFLAGALKSSHQNISDLWSSDGTGVDLFRCTMNQRRFSFLLRALRFDNPNTRAENVKIDKLSKIREVFEPFVESCQSAYNPSEYTTIDEMLEKFRGRCQFRQYLPNKPGKYGIKIFALCCARTFYTVKLEIYPGTQPPGPFQQSNKVIDVVERMVSPIIGTGRNVTMDNWFVSVPMAKHLLDDHKLTVVGTIKKNKPELPLIFRSMTDRPIHSSLFAFQPKCTLVSYAPKKKKTVTLLSTMHQSDSIDPTSEASKPEILTFYNLTKGGVDVVDEMKNEYSISRVSRRWPLTLFFSMLNIGGINGYLIFKANTQSTIPRKDFIKKLSWDLCEVQMKKRATIMSMPKTIKERIREMFAVRGNALPDRPVGAARPRPPGPGRCDPCGYKKSRRTNTTCARCGIFICREHSTPTCPNCSDVRPIEDDSE